MHLYPINTKLANFSSAIKPTRKKYSKFVHGDAASKFVRRKFLDYFVKDKNHNYVQSSPVVPHHDPTIPFVNAGMNQFKGVFLGTHDPEYTRAANSQKCIRVSGKHNDLDVIGKDGYHHTFFEMLGNWSFGDYFKKEACEMAWNLLTNVYNINKNRLYVTYFSGDIELNLNPDEEVRDIWLSIGVARDRILPFGAKDNFWEMGTTGPCGPCTEIHVDLLGHTNRSNFINKGLPDLTELWNIVFIEYNRNINGGIEPLPVKHVDTGMGFERLTALLQNTTSNYDTDLFTDLFGCIRKVCKNVDPYEGKYGERDWNQLDTSYRILADHSRMITVALADGMIPDENQKLRKVMRKAFLLGETVFKREKGLLNELSYYVVESLGSTYPEMEKNIEQIQQIIRYEETLYQHLRDTSLNEWDRLVENEPKLRDMDVIEMPGLIAACKDIQLHKIKEAQAITPQYGYKLYDTYGLDVVAIGNLARALNLSFDEKGFHDQIAKVKAKSKEQSSQGTRLQEALLTSRLQPTDDSFKYSYSRKGDGYHFENVEVTVLQIFCNSIEAASVSANRECMLLLDKTNMYSEAGGQESDRGTILFAAGIFDVESTQKIGRYVLHKGTLRSSSNRELHVHANGVLSVKRDLRLKLMQNHTAVHLLNSALKKQKGVTCQVSSKVGEEGLKFDVSTFSGKLDMEDVQQIENQVRSIVNEGVDVTTATVNIMELYKMEDVAFLPGEVYPENGIRVVEIKKNDGVVSREPCCGTHVLNTADLEDFCVTGLKSLGRSTVSLQAVTGNEAKQARSKGTEIVRQVTKLADECTRHRIQNNEIENAVNSFRKQLHHKLESIGNVPIVDRTKCFDMLNGIVKSRRIQSSKALKEIIEREMQTVLEADGYLNKKYLVHFLTCSTVLDSVPLQNATKICKNVPVIVISLCGNVMKARCCVPKKLTNEEFNAETWLWASFGSIFNEKPLKQPGQDSRIISQMKINNISSQEWERLLNKSVEAARRYADKFLVAPRNDS